MWERIVLNMGIIKSTDINNLNSTVKSIATTAKKTDLTNSLSNVSANQPIKKISIENLRKAINNLESSFSNNCCQSVNKNCCQTCQSSKCQTCQSCQSQCNCNCDCDSH